MSDMERGRPKLDLGNDLDLSDFSIGDVAPGKKEPTAKEVKAVSNNAGFPSRSAGKAFSRRSRRKTSPFQDQIGIKCRSGMKELFQDLGDALETHDHTTFEKAVQALLNEVGDSALIKRFKILSGGE